MTDKTFKIEFNPLPNISPNGHYSIKTDDDIGTPIAIIPVSLGPFDAKDKAEAKAKRIVDCLNFCTGVEKTDEKQLTEAVLEKLLKGVGEMAGHGEFKDVKYWVYTYLEAFDQFENNPGS